MNDSGDQFKTYQIIQGICGQGELMENAMNNADVHSVRLTDLNGSGLSTFGLSVIKSEHDKEIDEIDIMTMKAESEDSQPLLADMNTFQSDRDKRLSKRKKMKPIQIKRPTAPTNSLLLINNVNSAGTKPYDTSPIMDFEIESAHESFDITDIAEVFSAFKCKNCSFITFDKMSLVLHSKTCLNKTEQTLSLNKIKNETEKVMFVCGKCSIPVESVEECRRHMIEDHKLQAKSCSENDVISKNSPLRTIKKEIIKKIKTGDKKPDIITIVPKIEEYWLTPKTKKEAQTVFRANRNIKCSLKNCLYKFSSIESMNVHRACHIEYEGPINKTLKGAHKSLSPAFSCFACSKSVENWPSCSLHLWRDHQIFLDLLSCPICDGLKTYGTSKMMQHLARHWQKIQSNNESTSLNEDSNIEEGEGKTHEWYAKIKCDICKKSFADCKSLKKHIQAVHKKIKPFICNVCGHSASRKHMLQLHMRQHTGEKPFKCTFCNYTTSDHNTLRKHTMRHTGERPYQCRHCTYKSIQSVSLKHHMKTAHSDKADDDEKEMQKSDKNSI